MLKIKTSRYNKEIEKAIFSKAKDDFENNRKTYIIVPEQFTLDNEIKLMNELEADSVMDIKIMSFNRLASEALSNIGGIKRRYIDEIGKAMVIKRIFQEKKEDLLLYSSSSDKNGFIDEIIKLIAELKRSMILPEDLIKVSESQQSDILFSQKLKEIGLIYKSFEEKLKGKYVDNEDRIGQLSEIEDISYLGGTKIYIYSFFSFTEQEYKIIQNMLSSGLNIEIYLNLDTESLHLEDTFLTTKKTFDKLQIIAEAAKVKLENKNIILSNSNNREIEYLGDNIFKLIPNKTEENPKNILLYYAHNIEEEIKFAALDIKQKIIFENYRYKDILIVSTDTQIYNNDIKSIFKQYEIPCFIDEKRNITSSPISKFLMTIIKMLNGNFSSDELMIFLKSGFNELDIDDIQKFENHVLKRKLKANMFFEDKYFESEYYYEDELEKQAVLEVRKLIIDIFKNNLKHTKQQSTASVFAKNIFDIMVTINIPEKIQKFIEELKSNNYIDEANENGQIWNLFLKILDQSVELFDNELLEFSYYSEVLLQAFINHKLSVIPPSKDQVIVADIERSRSMDKKIVYVLGANNLSMPRIPKDNILLLKEDKAILKQCEIELPSDLENIDSRENLLIYNLLTKPEDKLYMSYAADSAGISVMPSILINQILQIYPKIKPKNNMDIPIEKFISTPKETIKLMAGEIKKYTKGQTVDEIWFKALQYYLNNQKYKPVAEIALGGVFYENSYINIEANKVKELYNFPFKVSTTRIDNFIKCPFSHFIKYGIKAKERKIYDIEPSEMGQVLHLTIEKFIEYIKQDLPSIDTITKSQTDQIIRELFVQSAQNSLKEYDLKEKRNQYILKKLNKTANFIGFNCVEQIKKGKFELLYQEERFGENSNIPPIIIEINNQQIILEGVIDRVDIYKDGEKTYVKVIDYKTRTKAFSLSDAYNGLDIQLIIYLKAAMQSKNLKKTENYPGGVFYFPIINPMVNTDSRDPQVIEELLKSQIKLDGIVLHDINVIKAINGEEEDVIKNKGRNKTEHLLELEQFESLIKKVESNIYDAVEGMISGIIDPIPVKSDKNQMTACDYCRYGAICKFDEELEENSYKVVPSYKTEEVIAMLEGGEDE